MRNKKAENQVKQALEMHPMSEADDIYYESMRKAEKQVKNTELASINDGLDKLYKPSLPHDQNGYPQEHTHGPYLVSEYKLVIRDGKQTVLKAQEYRCSTCLEVKS